jgi:transposase
VRCHAPDSQVLGLVACEELDIIKTGAHVGAMDHLWSCKNLKSVRVRHGQISTTKGLAISTIQHCTIRKLHYRPSGEVAEKWDEQVSWIGETIAMKKPSQHLIIAEVPRSITKVGMTIGIDLGDVWSHYCTLNEDGEVVDRGRFRTTPSGVEKWFTDLPRARVAMETGTHSIWISEQLRELGHEVIVANVRELRAISHSDRKSDKVDAEKIARYARLDPKILRPISHRTVAQQEALTLIRARNLIVRLRTAAVNAVRGLAKPCGYRLPASSTLCFAKRSLAVLPPGLVQALGPVLQQIATMTVKIKQYDSAIKRLTETEYPETQALIQVYGVGQLTALTYILTLGSKERFQRSRDVGCYLGLRPKRSQSGDRDPQLGITMAGNIYLRTLLVECANHVLGPHGRDSIL